MPGKKKSTRGRPAVTPEHKSSTRLVARCTAFELESAQLAADEHGLKLSTFIRRACAFYAESLRLQALHARRR